MDEAGDRWDELADSLKIYDLVHTAEGFSQGVKNDLERVWEALRELEKWDKAYKGKGNFKFFCCYKKKQRTKTLRNRQTTFAAFFYNFLFIFSNFVSRPYRSRRRTK